MSGKVISVPIHDLFVDDQKHRLKLEIEDLAQSIQTAGQFQPIIVTKVKDEYRVVAGRRRYAALNYIQEVLTPEKQVKALVYVMELNELEKELIKIDENIMRQQIKGAELDEAIFRRKQIYEELNPETKQHLSGAHAKHAKEKGKKKPAPAFTFDAAKKLQVSRRTVEKSIARAAKASEKVKKAREAGDLTPSKVDLLVMLEPPEQDMLLSIVKNKELSEVKGIISQAKRRGAKAVVLELQDVREEAKHLKPLIRDAIELSERLQEALEARLTLEGDSKHDSLRALDLLGKRIEKFASFQRTALGYVKAISHKGGERKLFRTRG